MSRSSLHTFCQDQKQLQRNNCSQVLLTKSSKLTYLLAVNGVRNKIAFSWKISNMNWVHWSVVLQKMAERFLLQCSLDLDECTFLGKPSHKINICQNIAFISSTEDDQNTIGYAVRKWYSEYEEDSSFEEFNVRIKEVGHSKITNFVHMTWPKLELMGCASSKYG